ncbi:MAG: FMN-binding glutamate synthase family protein, partial [Pseudomonadota bacterium]
MIRFIPFLIALAVLALSLWGAQFVSWLYAPAALLTGIVLLGLYDLIQTRHTLWRNFPILGRLRWIAEAMRPFFRSYMVESQTEGRPFNHEERAMVYRRAKNVSSVEPFGSHLDIENPPYEWLAHSIAASHPDETDPRIL